jgi:hypothetical protein
MHGYTDVHVISQRRATNALIKFCDDHEHGVDGVEELRACLKALNRKDMRVAFEIYLGIPLGRMGCFDDWLPPVVFKHETPEYNRAVFEALVTQWGLLMQLAKSDNQ